MQPIGGYFYTPHDMHQQLCLTDVPTAILINKLKIIISVLYYVLSCNKVSHRSLLLHIGFIRL